MCDYCQGNGVVAPRRLVLEAMFGLRHPNQVVRPCPKCSLPAAPDLAIGIAQDGHVVASTEIVPKAPRQSRQAGELRGLSGDWQSYCDGCHADKDKENESEVENP